MTLKPTDQRELADLTHVAADLRAQLERIADLLDGPPPRRPRHLRLVEGEAGTGDPNATR